MTNGILKFIEGPLDGDSWENLCNSCYRMHYINDHYTEIPAVYKGDAGIEGFTQTGIVNQCYCPEREYSDNELYDHMRDKMTTDIAKLISADYKKRFVKMGVPKIREWHFLVPYYKDSRIIEHAEKKRKEVLCLKKKSPTEYDYIDENFVILIKTAENYRVEITRLIRTTLTDVKLNFAIQHTGIPDWEKCDSDKVNNIKRKVKAVMGNVDESNIEQYNEVVNLYVQSYIKGMDIMNTLRVSYAEVYEDIFSLEQQYKRQVEIQTKMNTNSSINSQLFNKILDDFESKLATEFSYLNMASIMELKFDLISSWLADCSMQFRG
jgi:hypothetical protein